MKFLEIEQKYRLKDPPRIRTLLKRLNARLVAKGLEINEFFDSNNFLGRQKAVLRLRRFGGKAVLTLKGPRLQAKFTKRMEIETPVNYAATKALLGFLGCRSIMEYSKKREIYRFGTALVTIDFLPKFGWFLEIEGAPQKIAKISRNLGLRPTDREEKSYLKMLFGIRH